MREPGESLTQAHPSERSARSFAGSAGLSNSRVGLAARALLALINAKLRALSYGGTAAIVTSMGLIVGLRAGAASRSALVSSLLLVALADNLTDSLAIHVYQESEHLDGRRAFRATVGNFLVRFFVAMSFVLLVLALPSAYLVPLTLGWGMVLLSTLTWLVARSRGAPPFVEVAKHLALAVVVIGVSRAIGDWIVAHVS
jgi:VIT1/CCC1 family predicted Fe2+/Mn2+ transporter